tara:strand:- start:716 stop:970 length:255 start_codon:yes stop_codon:yes gene_type:complete
MKVSEYNIQTGESKFYEVPDEVQPTELIWDTLRIKRDMKLKETDVYALSDRTMSDEMKTYRQALRDLPANTSDPSNPTWPTKPS